MLISVRQYQALLKGDNYWIVLYIILCTYNNLHTFSVRRQTDLVISVGAAEPLLLAEGAQQLVQRQEGGPQVLRSQDPSWGSVLVRSQIWIPVLKNYSNPEKNTVLYPATINSCFFSIFFTKTIRKGELKCLKQFL